MRMVVDHFTLDLVAVEMTLIETQKRVGGPDEALDRHEPAAYALATAFAILRGPAPG